jgi:hypothetical protein
LRHATLIHRGAEEGIFDPDDRAEIDEHYTCVLKALGEPLPVMAEAE